MARISIKDAERMGLIPKNNSKKPEKKESDQPKVKRQSAKGGRKKLDAHQEKLDIVFNIHLDPKTKERPRTYLSKVAIEAAFHKSKGSFTLFKKLLDGIPHRTFTPTDTVNFENAVAIIASAAMRGRTETIDEAIHVDLIFTFKGDPNTWPTDVTDPDLDNAEKAIFDAINKVVWRDDSLAVGKRSVKICGPISGIWVRVRDAYSALTEIGLPNGQPFQP